MNVGAGTLTVNGPTTIGSNKELVVTSPDASRIISLYGVIADNPDGSSGVTITGGGQVNMTTNNTYTGQTVVGAGRLFINKPEALGSTNGNTVIHVLGSSVTGGTLTINSPISNNYGSVNLHSGPGTIIFNAANNTIGDMNVQYKHILSSASQAL